MTITACTDTSADRDLTATGPREGLPEMLWGYAMFHDAILRDTGRLPAAISRVRSRPDVDRLACWLGLFEQAIVHHHRREDDLVFPFLARRCGFDADELTTDHHRLDALFDELRGAIERMRGTETAGAAPGDRPTRHAVAVATELDEVMVRHLREEELAVFPLVAARVELEQEWRAIEREIQKGTSLREAAFELPWALDGANPAFVDHLHDDLPLPFRIINALFWQRAYDRVAAPLHGGVS